MANRHYEVHLSEAYDDPEWDSFVETARWGHFEQTSRWAQVKRVGKWEPLRFYVISGQKIVAGCQILLRRLPIIGYVGYISKGPVLSLEGEELYPLVTEKICKLCRRKRIQYLVLQPPDNGRDFEAQLSKIGFSIDLRLRADRATTVIDLTSGLDAIFAKMSKNNRRFIRHGERSGVTVREGSDKDISLFFRMMLETCKRRGEKPNPPQEDFFYEIWSVFAPFDQAKLFFAECRGTVVSGLFCIPFSNTFKAWKLGWSGEYAQLRPNQVMFWESIKWARNKGYAYYDFVGIDRNAAEEIIKGRHFSEVAKADTFFKLMFGGEIRLLPSIYTYIYNPLFRYIFQSIYPMLLDNASFLGLVEKRLGYSARNSQAMRERRRE